LGNLKGDAAGIDIQWGEKRGQKRESTAWRTSEGRQERSEGKARETKSNGRRQGLRGKLLNSNFSEVTQGLGSEGPFFQVV